LLPCSISEIVRLAHAHINPKNICRQLHLTLSTLLGEQGLQHIVPGMKKESFTTIISIFKSIKYSQDIVDVTKTKVGNGRLMF
jgi:hypothetical protein